MTVDDVLRDTARLLAEGNPTTVGPPLAVQLHRTLVVAAGGDPDLYLAARDRVAIAVGAPLAAWALAGGTKAAAAAACDAAAHPVLDLVSGS